MGGTRRLGLALGGVAFVAGLVAIALDVPFVGVVAGLSGLAAALVLASAVQSAERALEDGRHASDARTAELESSLTDAEKRFEELEELVAANDAASAFEAAEAEAFLDPETGLYGEPFFGITLASRVAAARRHLRPVAVVLVEVASGVRDGTPKGADPALVGRHVRATLREADTACYLEDSRFALVLEDTPENGAVWTVERVRRALASERNDLTLWAGVACYPAHAFDGDELRTRATAALEAAKEWRQDRIEVATTSEV